MASVPDPAALAATRIPDVTVSGSGIGSNFSLASWTAFSKASALAFPSSPRPKDLSCFFLSICQFCLAPNPSRAAGPFREWLQERRMGNASKSSDGYGPVFNNLSCEKLVRLANRKGDAAAMAGSIQPTYVASYGQHKAQAFNVYMGFPWSFIQSIRNYPTSKRIHIPGRGNS